MRKKLFLLFTAALLVLLIAFPSFAEQKSSSYAEGEVLVLLKPGTTLASSASLCANTQRTANLCASAAASAANSVGAKTVATFNSISQTSGNVFAHLRSETKTADELVRELSKNPNVLAVSKNYIARTCDVTPNDTRFSEQWGVKKINAPKAWNKTRGSNDVVVAVIDTGIIYDHEDLAANMWHENGIYGKMFHDNGKSCNITGVGGTSGATSSDWHCVGDIKGHGTHVAGIIGAVGNNGVGVCGVNWNVKILTVGVFSFETSDGLFGAYLSDVINGLNYVTSLKKSGVNIRVINMSFGFYATENDGDVTLFKSAVSAASNAGTNGIVICSSAGNGDGTGYTYGYDLDTCSEKMFPACFKFDSTLSVGASTSEDTHAYYSNYSTSGKWVDVFAPGNEILSTVRTSALNGYDESEQACDSSGYKRLSGTSMASPMVAGAAALLCAAYPDKSAADIKYLLTSTCTNVCQAECSRYGQIDVKAAMDMGAKDSVRVTGVTLDYKSLTVDKNSITQLTATILPENASNRKITWSSSNSSVASVDGSGLVTALSSGSAVITATTNDGDFQAKCTVTVKSSEEPSSDGGGGGGCNAGFVGFGLLALGALCLVKRNRK